MANKIRSWAIVVVVGCILGGCAYPYNKDRPYDPDFDKGESLFDQIPNWKVKPVRCARDIYPQNNASHIRQGGASV